MFTNISPSRMPRIVNCPGSVNLCKQFPGLLEDEGEEARQGTLAHWLSQQKLSQRIDPWEFLNKTPINDQVVDREMILHVLEYCKIVEMNGTGYIEQRFEISKDKFSGFGGTPDFIFYDRLQNILTIIDLKYGFVPVSPYKNWQLLTYAWLFNQTFPDTPIKSVKMEIYQPRIPTEGGVYKTWEVPFLELACEYTPKIERSLIDCQLSTSITRAGDHCHYCPAMLQCNSNLQTCLKIVNLGGRQYGQEPTGEQLGNQLKLFRFASKILEKRLQVLETVAEHRLKSGEIVPGYTLKLSKGKRYRSVSDLRARRAGWPEEPIELMSVRQAEINGFPPALIDKFSKQRTSVKLTEFDINEVEEILKKCLKKNAF